VSVHLIPVFSSAHLSALNLKFRRFVSREPEIENKFEENSSNTLLQDCPHQGTGLCRSETTVGFHDGLVAVIATSGPNIVNCTCQ